MTTVVCCPCGRSAASLSQPASTTLMNASTWFGNGGACSPDSSWSRFQSATNAS